MLMAASGRGTQRCSLDMPGPAPWIRWQAEAQLEALSKAGCERLFQEQVSSVGKRPALEGALGFVREEDTLVVTKLDRLARSVAHLGEIVATLGERKVGLRVLDLGLD